jgi:uncharacterized protein YebE (UPF0316 family)
MVGGARTRRAHIHRSTSLRATETPVFEQFLADLSSLWAVLWPALTIALLRMCDVSLNVFRTVFVVQERRLLAALVAGTEASVWLAAAGIVFADMTPVRIGGFVVGVAAGTATGVEVARRLRLGMTTVRIYADATHIDADGRELSQAIADAIRSAGHGVTVFRGAGREGPVDMVLSTVRRRDAEAVLALARSIDPDTFAAIDNTLYRSPSVLSGSVGRV